MSASTKSSKANLREHFTSCSLRRCGGRRATQNQMLMVAQPFKTNSSSVQFNFRLRTLSLSSPTVPWRALSRERILFRPLIYPRYGFLCLIRQTAPTLPRVPGELPRSSPYLLPHALLLEGDTSSRALDPVLFAPSRLPRFLVFFRHAWHHLSISQWVYLFSLGSFAVPWPWPNFERRWQASLVAMLAAGMNCLCVHAALQCSFGYAWTEWFLSPPATIPIGIESLRVFSSAQRNTEPGFWDPASLEQALLYKSQRSHCMARPE